MGWLGQLPDPSPETRWERLDERSIYVGAHDLSSRLICRCAGPARPPAPPSGAPRSRDDLGVAVPGHSSRDATISAIISRPTAACSD